MTSKRRAAARPAKRRTAVRPAGPAPATFAAWLAARTPAERRTVAALRVLVARVAPALVEGAKWTNGCWLLGGKPVCYAHAAADHVQFGFFRGAALADPLRLLRGAGQHVRHVRLRRAADVDAPALAALLRQAVARARADADS